MKSTRKILKEPRQAPRAGAGLLAVLLFLFGFVAPLGAQAAEIPQNSRDGLFKINLTEKQRPYLKAKKAGRSSFRSARYTACTFPPMALLFPG